MKTTGEFALIHAFVRSFGSMARRYARVGPGDDAAVLPPLNESLCVTTDAVFEGVHFSRRTFSLRDVGHKALAVNLSDLAAMGAEPLWCVCAVAAPASLSLADARALASGMGTLAKATNTALVGGNFTRAKQLSLTLTVAGRCPPGQALLRSGAQPGDVLFVSGSLGAAAWALRALSAGRPVSRRDRQRRPQPRLRLGLVARGLARAAIDVSDGLVQDLSHLCRASGVGVRVALDHLPISPELAGEPPARARQLALAGGEDYELLLAVPPNHVWQFEQSCARVGERVTRIGVFEIQKGVRLVDGHEKLSKVPSGFDHFI